MMPFAEFTVTIRVRGVGLDQQAAIELVAMILDNAMDHHGDDWGAENRLSLMIPGREGAEDEPRFFPGDDHYEDAAR